MARDAGTEHTRDMTRIRVEEVETFEVSSLVKNKNNLYQFLLTFSYDLTPPRLNTLIKFRLANIS